jgi:hypothetical protein
VAVSRRQVHRPDLQPADWAVLAALSRLSHPPAVGDVLRLPGHATSWHGNLIARAWTYPTLHRDGHRYGPELEGVVLGVPLRVAV